MKIFKLLPFIVLALVLTYSCDPVQQEEPKEKATLTINSQDLSFDDKGGTYYLSFTTNKNWTISSDSEWCKPESNSGEAGFTTLALSVDANPGYDPRTCVLTIQVGEKELVQSISIEQSFPYAIKLENHDLEFNYEERTIQVVVSTNIEKIRASVTSDPQRSVISIEEQAQSKGLSEKVFIVKLAENQGQDRSAEICFEDASNPKNKTGLYIRQRHKVIIEQYRDVIYLSSAEDQYCIKLDSSDEVELYIPEEASSWIKLISSKSEQATYNRLGHEYIFEFSENKSDQARTAGIVFQTKEKDGSVTSATTIIEQAKYEPLAFVASLIDNTSPASLRLYNAEVVIDWGDGTSEAIVGENCTISHEYENRNLSHIIRIKGKTSQIEYICPYGLSKIVQWGKLEGLRKLDEAFYQQTSLYQLPKYGDTEGFFEEVESMRSLFALCYKLKTIPEKTFARAKNDADIRLMFDLSGIESVPAGLFDAFTHTKSFDRVFWRCYKLSELPLGLFAKCNEAKSFEETFQNCIALKKLPQLLFVSNSASSFKETFCNCLALEEIPEDLFKECVNAVDFNGTFGECESLKAIPEGLFSNNPKANNFSVTFAGCKAIKEIPEKLFASCKNVTSFSGTFASTSVEFLPEGLFSSSTKATNFSNVFLYCDKLRAIPNGIFRSNRSAERFDGAFFKCISLTELPGDLFSNNLKAYCFDQTFAGCVNLTGESPYRIGSDGRHIHLYQRPDLEFHTLTGYACFESCTGLSDYEDIPKDWKTYQTF